MKPVVQGKGAAHGGTQSSPAMNCINLLQFVAYDQSHNSAQSFYPIVVALLTGSEYLLFLQDVSPRGLYPLRLDRVVLFRTVV